MFYILKLILLNADIIISPNNGYNTKYRFNNAYNPTFSVYYNVDGFDVDYISRNLEYLLIVDALIIILFR